MIIKLYEKMFLLVFWLERLKAVLSLSGQAKRQANNSKAKHTVPCTIFLIKK